MFPNKAIFAPPSPCPKLALGLRGMKLDEATGLREGFISKTKWDKGWKKGFDSMKHKGTRCHSTLMFGCHSTKVSAAAKNPKSMIKRTSHPFEKTRILRKHSTSAASENTYAPEPPADADHSSKTDLFFGASKQFDVLRRFFRPFAAMGHIVGISSVSLLAVESTADLSPVFFMGLLQALVSTTLMHIYVVGVNQLSDIEIDKINKPTLPLASGELSMKNAIILSAASTIMSFGLGLHSGSPPLLFTLIFSFLFLGSAYSLNLPFLRWKQHHLLSAFCMAGWFGITINLACFLHMKAHVLGRPAVFTKPVLFATAFITCLTAVFALFKDISDIDGDKKLGVRTLSVRLGAEGVFWLCIKIMLSAYAAAMLFGLSYPNLSQKLVIVLGHGLFASLLWFQAQSADVHNKKAMLSFYMFIWKLFYAEYLLIQFMR